jgi:hypothetical protein
VRFRSPHCRGGKFSRQIDPDNDKSILVDPHSATTREAHHVWGVAMQRESRLSGVRKRRDRALSTLLACRQSSTALPVLLVNDAEHEEEKLRKLLTRRSRLMMRSFNIQEWSQDGSVRKFRFCSADISQITRFRTSLRSELSTVDSAPCAHGKQTSTCSHDVWNIDMELVRTRFHGSMIFHSYDQS